MEDIPASWVILAKTASSQWAAALKFCQKDGTWVGSVRCEQANDCLDVACGGKSTCTDGSNKFTCNCATGWVDRGEGLTCCKEAPVGWFFSNLANCEMAPCTTAPNGTYYTTNGGTVDRCTYERCTNAGGGEYYVGNHRNANSCPVKNCVSCPDGWYTFDCGGINKKGTCIKCSAAVEQPECTTTTVKATKTAPFDFMMNSSLGFWGIFLVVSSAIAGGLIFFSLVICLIIFCVCCIRRRRRKPDEAVDTTGGVPPFDPDDAVDSGDKVTSWSNDGLDSDEDTGVYVEATGGIESCGVHVQYGRAYPQSDSQSDCPLTKHLCHHFRRQIIRQIIRLIENAHNRTGLAPRVKHHLRFHIRRKQMSRRDHSPD